MVELSKREIKRSSDKVFKGSKDSDFYNRAYFLSGVNSNYGCGEFIPYDEQYLERDRATVPVLINFLRDHQSELKSVIVLGCARGYLVQAFREKGVDAVGVDISEWAVENCAEGMEDHVFCGDVCDLSKWPDGAFTLALGFDIFEHITVPDLHRAINEACRVAEWVVINLPINPDDEHPDMSSGQDKSHVSVYSKTWWVQRFMEAGHEPVDIQEWIYPKPSPGSLWEDKRDHNVTIYFRKAEKNVAVKLIPTPTIRQGGKDFKILWWSNGPWATCFDYETEVLTRNGWKFFKDLEYIDEVATLNPATHEVEYYCPEAIINEPYSGLMYHQESQSLSIMCTPNHKLYVAKKGEPYRLTEAKEIFGKNGVEHMGGWAQWSGEDKPKYEITHQQSKCPSKEVGEVDTLTFVDWLGWYISEGSFTRGTKEEFIVGLALNHKEADEVFELSQKTFPTLKWFKIPEKYKVNIRTYSKDLYYYVEKLGRSHQKHIPKDIKNLSKKYLEKLLTSLIRGDGHENGRTPTYITVSEKLRDDVQEIAIKLGYATNYYKHHSKGSKNFSKSLNRVITSNYNSWMISIKKARRTPKTHQGKLIEEWVVNPDGRIYCAVVPPNHIMTVRRHGKVYFSGNTGYGLGTKHVVYPLNEHYDVACLAYWGLEGAALNFNGLKVFPKMYDQFGIDAADLICRNWKPDIMVTLFDIWIGDSPLFNGERDWFSKIHPRHLAYFPVDHYPIPVPILNQAEKAYHCVAMSKFGLQELRKHNINASLIPHGVDTKTYCPVEDRAIPRKWLIDTAGVPLFSGQETEKWDHDSFIIGKVAANKDTSRKGFDREMAGFKIFLEQNPDAKKDARMYWHTDPRFPGGYHLDHYAHLMEIDKFIKKTHPFYLYGGISEPNMAKMYQSFDLFTNVSRAEGFGIPIIESQSCGVPVVTNDSCSMPELVKDHGWVCKPKTWEPTALLSNVFIADEYEIAKAYEEAYNNPDKRKKHGVASRDFAEQYDWDNIIVPLWVQLMERLREGMREKTYEERRITF